MKSLIFVIQIALLCGFHDVASAQDLAGSLPGRTRTAEKEVEEITSGQRDSARETTMLTIPRDM